MTRKSESTASQKTWREQCYEVIFEADTWAGKLFDVVLLLAILLSVLVIMLDSVQSVACRFRHLLIRAEWFFTAIFTVEYIARLWCSRRPIRYALSFYGVIDLLAILPTYISLFPSATGAQQLAVVRSLRLMRTFRIFKLAHMLSEAGQLQRALAASRNKIAVFLAFVLIIVVIVGSAMHLIEGPEHGFTSIPKGMYWAIVTMTTVGYGDIVPQTTSGKVVAAVIMFLGYAIIVVPMGIVSAELAQSVQKPVTTQVCPDCLAEGHDLDAKHCKYCGGRL